MNMFDRKQGVPVSFQALEPLVLNSTISCSPVDEFTANQMVLTVTLVCISVALLLIVCCSLLCCKYRRLRSQYYEKVDLIKASGATRNSDLGSPDKRRGGKRIEFEVQE
jgi:hypothetical protein